MRPTVVLLLNFHSVILLVIYKILKYVYFLYFISYIAGLIPHLF
jgi:hypothetical protein